MRETVIRDSDGKEIRLGTRVAFRLMDKACSGRVLSIEQGVANIRGDEQKPRSHAAYHVPVKELIVHPAEKSKTVQRIEVIISRYLPFNNFEMVEECAKKIAENL